METARKAALGLAVIFVIMAWSSTWFEITGTGTYVEGLNREPTISTQYSIENDEQTFELSIENATPLLLYWIEREEITPREAPSEESSEQPDSEADADSEDKQSEPCNGECMDTARESLAALMAVFASSLAASAFRPSRWVDAAAGVTWLSCLALIVLGIPMAAAADFGIFGSGDDDEGGGSSTGGFDSDTDGSVSVDQFAHFSSKSGISLSSSGIVFSYDSVGFDLGLLDKRDRQAVIDSAPSEGENGYESMIGFHGELVAGPGSIFSWWFLILPLYAYSLRRKLKPAVEEE